MEQLELQEKNTNLLVLLRLWQLVYFTIGVAAIFGFSYLCGHKLLEGILGGNDTSWALSLVYWLDRWFPDLPIWYPLQGGGTPLLVYYPTGTHLLAVLLHRLLNLTEVQSFRLLGFLSVPITATGIYLLVWVKLRNQTMALLAGIFYPLSAAAWTWLSYIGIYAQAVSLIYFAPTFLLFDMYLTKGLGKEDFSKKVSDQICFMLASVLFCLMFLSHAATALCFSMVVLLYAILLPWIIYGRTNLLQGLRTSVIRALSGILGGLSLSAFWLIPFLRAQSLINREGLSEFAAHQTPYTDLGALLGLREPPPNFGIWHVQFAVPVVVLGVLGLVLALRRRNAVAAWSVVAVSLAVFTSMPGLLPEVVAIFDRLWAYTHIRAISGTMILLPAVAGYGAVSVAELIFDFPVSVFAKLRKIEVGLLFKNRIIQIAKYLLVAFLGIFLACSSVLIFKLNPHRCGEKGIGGPPTGEAFWPFCFSDNAINLRHQPQFVLSTEGPDIHRDSILSFIPQLGINETTRMDVSAFLGGLTQALSLYTDASIIGIYNYQSSMIHAMWGLEQGVFYSTEYGTPYEMDQLAWWLGIQYVVLNKDYDPLEKYDLAGWPVVYSPSGTVDGGIEIRQYPDAPQMTSLLTQPVLLVVGGFENGSYDQIFRTFISEPMGYEDWIFVEGTHNIDDYTLDELMNFDGVVLHGYGYKNSDNAWGMLDKYVTHGGSLYVDTGWQFVTPDWEVAEAPSVLPVRNLIWTDFGATDNFIIDQSFFGESIEVGEFSSLTWDNQPWSVSYPSEGIRDWANPVLYVEGSPIIVAGEYGQGRVVWSGMNFIGHALANNNLEEREFLRLLISWLAPKQFDNNLSLPLVQRDHPDHIRFTLEGSVFDKTSLLWREAFSPDWHATVEIDGREVEIPIYRAGPGMMLLFLPVLNEPGMVINMDYNLGWRGWVGLAITLLTFFTLFIGVISPSFLQMLIGRFRRLVKRQPSKGSVEWLPDLEVAEYPKPEAQPEAYDVSANGDVSPNLEILWAKLVESGKVSETDDHEADHLIKWWRRSRSGSIGLNNGNDVGNGDLG